MATDPDDPFAPRSDDRTVMVPKPRRAQGAKPSEPTPAPPPPAAPSRTETPNASPLPDSVGQNPLVAAATPILALIPQLRVAAQADAAQLKSKLVDSVKQFEQNARRAQVPSNQIVAARYVLCTFLDETAANTPWGGSGQWSTQSLLVTFHNEAWGGEKTFQLLAKLAEKPRENRDLLELLEHCLALGFQGRFRVADNGAAQLMQVRERLFDLLRKERGEPEQELSPRWAGVRMPGNAVLDAVPVWVVVAATAFVLTLSYLIFNTLLNRQSDPVFASLRTIEAPQAEARAAPPKAPEPKPVPPRLRTLLASDIAANLVDVGDYADRSVVTIRSDGFFAPGSDSIPNKMMPLLDRIADAVSQVPGHVLVVGHSDNVPIRSVRFPSNWHLSSARAERVAERLGETVDPSRIRAEGRAESEPIAPNDTAANRAKNRRVDVQVLIN